MKRIIIMVSLLFTITVAVAGTPAERLIETAQDLDESVQAVELDKMLPAVAKLLKTETATLEKALFFQKMK
jgi:hypothetical protein